MKVALVHDWLTGMRGGERCLEIFCELFPDADIYTLLWLKGSVSATIEHHPIRTSFIQHLPLASTRYRYYLPLFPWAIESFDLTGYDLVISLSHCVAKGVRVPKGTCHLSYVFTPMRYIWDQYDTYFPKKENSWLVSAVMGIVRPWLQRWDVRSSSGVHGFIAISEHVAGRIQRHYGKSATVVYPPVNWQSFQASEENDGFYLMVTAFAPYKKVDLAIQVANRLKVQLKIIGKGQEEKHLNRLAGPTVEFLGWKSDEQIREFYRKCLALLFPGEEDFGIVPLEAMASGKPVIAFGKGGVLETVIPLNPVTSIEGTPYPTGVFFYEQTVNGLIEALQLFEKRRSEFQPEAIRAHVKAFDRERFKERIKQVIMTNYEQYRQSRTC